VGFRPFVHRLARDNGLTGTVRNTSDGVRIEVQGEARSVRRFCKGLREDLPPLARLASLVEETLAPVRDEKDFTILASLGHAGHSVLVSPDVGICEDCLADMRDAANRRFAYPFTNCTNCGPRFTITRAIPYDRATTAMSCFPLCPDCAGEYDHPADRRFHAQPIACPVCGPRLWFVDKTALETASDTGPTEENRRDALARAENILLSGGILALKGLGGFQLACDARNSVVVSELRRRKDRPHKALALMVRDMAAARALCAMEPEHEALLQSVEKPIVLCPRRAWGEASLCLEIAPDSDQIGLMLPGAPLHAALFDRLASRAGIPPVLVMTSANARGEPICLDNREALARLAGMADAWLLHDRDILCRVDDSVLAAPSTSGAPLFFRRARGYVPRPLSLAVAVAESSRRTGSDSSFSTSNSALQNAVLIRNQLHSNDLSPEAGPCVFGAGAELKNTFCLTRVADAFVSQHIGDMENPATAAFYEEAAQHLEKLLEVRPQAFVCDAHPDFFAGRYARERAAREGLPLWELQHHAAHAASVLAENCCREPALALCLDGAGFGPDNTVWGGELLFMDLSAARWRRVGRLTPFALPGGDNATREPWRIALALQKLARANIALPASPDAPTDGAIRAVREMLEKNLQCPQTSSCGRLFDAVSAQLGLCLKTTYEGQAAIRLEQAADKKLAKNGVVQPVGIVKREELLELDSAVLFVRVLDALKNNEPASAIAARFHLNLACGFAEMAARAGRALGVSKVGLSGGVMQNALLAGLLTDFLEQQGITPLLHHELPPGDGGLSFGQAVWGRILLRGV
jgi:hydrogenase maturation protein HypF